VLLRHVHNRILLISCDSTAHVKRRHVHNLNVMISCETEAHVLGGHTHNFNSVISCETEAHVLGGHTHNFNSVISCETEAHVKRSHIGTSIACLKVGTSFAVPVLMARCLRSSKVGTVLATIENIYSLEACRYLMYNQRMRVREVFFASTFLRLRFCVSISLSVREVSLYMKYFYVSTSASTFLRLRFCVCVWDVSISLCVSLRLSPYVKPPLCVKYLCA
jgi:hypothetical protein